jgi:hypothetical protein
VGEYDYVTKYHFFVVPKGIIECFLLMLIIFNDSMKNNGSVNGYAR